MKGPLEGRSSFASGVLTPKSTAAPRPLATPRARPGADIPKATPTNRSWRGPAQHLLTSPYHLEQVAVRIGTLAVPSARPSNVGSSAKRA